MSGSSNHRVLILVAAALLLAGCATSPTGRSQLQFFSEADMAQMGDKAFEQTRKKSPTVQDPAVVNYVKCVVDALAVAVPAPGGGVFWQVTVFREDTANAFALPGGHIGVYTGIFDVARTQAELAAVIGHEIGHLMAHHPNARLSTEYATQSGLQLIGMLADGETAQSRQLMALLGLGAQVGVVLPFSRAQESEADKIGGRYTGASLHGRGGFRPEGGDPALAEYDGPGRNQAAGFSFHPSD